MGNFGKLKTRQLGRVRVSLNIYPSKFVYVDLVDSVLCQGLTRLKWTLILKKRCNKLVSFIVIGRLL